MSPRLKVIIPSKPITNESIKGDIIDFEQQLKRRERLDDGQKELLKEISNTLTRSINPEQLASNQSMSRESQNKDNVIVGSRERQILLSRIIKIRKKEIALREEDLKEEFSSLSKTL